MGEILETIWIVVRDRQIDHRLPLDRDHVDVHLLHGRAIPGVLEQLVQDEDLALAGDQIGEPLLVDREPLLRCCPCHHESSFFSGFGLRKETI